MERKISWATGADIALCRECVKERVKEMNKEGFELTFIAIQSKDNNPASLTEAILVFTKK